MRTRSAVDTLPSAPPPFPADGACASAPELTDRRGEHFPVLRAWGCRSEIENGKILYLADKAQRLAERLACAMRCLRFTTEIAAEDCVQHAARVSG